MERFRFHGSSLVYRTWKSRCKSRKISLSCLHSRLEKPLNIKKRILLQRKDGCSRDLRLFPKFRCTSPSIRMMSSSPAHVRTEHSAERINYKEDLQANKSDSSSSPKDSSSQEYIDNPCWGSPTECSLTHLLQKYTRQDCVLYESPDYLAINKPPDLRMDGDYPATVHKLLTYWFPPPSVLQDFERHLKEHGDVNHDGDETAQIDAHSNEQNEEVVSEVCNSKSQSTGRSSPIEPRHLLSFQHFIETTYVRHSDHPDNALRPCHQLDYATSGVLLVARSKAAANQARQSMEDRTVQKAYLAVVRGDVAKTISQYFAKQNRYSNSTVWLESMDQVHQTFRSMDVSHRKQRQRTNRKTFPGYLPPPALFQQWMAYEKRKRALDQQESSTATTKTSAGGNADAPTGKRNNKNDQQQHEQEQRSVGNAKKRRLSSDQWQHVWGQLYEPSTDNEREKETAEFAFRSDLTWKQVRQDGQTFRFQQAASAHNEFLRELHERYPVEEEEKSQIAPASSSSLPLVFGIRPAKETDTEEGRDIDEKRTFFVCASIAEIPKQFQVVLQSEETKPLSPPSFLLAPSAQRLRHQRSIREEKKKQTKVKNQTKHKEGDGDDDIDKIVFRPCLTQCRILAYNKHDDTTKVLLIPWSGRRHQLRIHMALLGHAIAGDPTYRRSRQNRSAQMCLHAHRLSFPLSKTSNTDKNNSQQRLELEAPDPF